MSLMEPTRPAAEPPTPAPASPATGVTRAVPQPERAVRHGRAARPSDGSRGRTLRLTIGLKLGLIVGLLLAVLASSAAVLIGQNRATAQAYEQILDREVRQSLLARQLQVEYKKRVQEWKDILLRGSDPADLKQYSANFTKEGVAVDGLYRQLVASGPDPRLAAQLKRVADLDTSMDRSYDQAYSEFVASEGKDFASADRVVRGIDRPLNEQVDRIVADLEAKMARDVAAQQALTAERQRLTAVVTACFVALLAALLTLALVRIVRPVRALTRQADRAASEDLPAAVARLKTLRPDDDLPTLRRFDVTTSDELADLAEALTSLQDSALEQAIAQHRADRETADMLVNLGRRNQNLLGRMLSYVTDLERQEEDPDVLAQLFRLDHATTRIRRNAESMLVLAGATQTRTWSRPVPVIDVVRASLSEIEEYVRVDLHHMEDALVNGSAVADVVHLVAELVENATHFSPPTTQVTVVGQHVREGYRLRVIDQGVGMTRRELDEANRRINRADGGWADSKLLGLYVVGRLARRRSVEVSLEASAGRGITASVLLPPSVLSASTNAAAAPALPVAAADPTGTAATLGTAGAFGIAGSEPTAMSATSATTATTEAAGPAGPAARTAAEVQLSGSREVEVHLPRSREVEVGTFTASEPPRPTLPAALGGLGRFAGPDGPRTIDLTDRSGTPDHDPLAASGVPVPWFDSDEALAAGPAGPSASTTRVPTTRVATPAGPVGAAPVIPRRVRGAQLPDLGPAAEPTIARPDDGPGAADSLRWQLRSFQLDVQAARRAINESDPASDGARPVPAPAPPVDVEQSEPIHDHHHEGE